MRSNCFTMLKRISPVALPAAKIGVASEVSKRLARGPGVLATAQVAVVSGTFPYLKKRQQRALIEHFTSRFSEIKPAWRNHGEPGELLDDFEAVGGFSVCPDPAIRRIVRWMIRAYVGEPGGYGTFGRGRAVFYSNTAARRIEKLLRAAPPSVKGDVAAISREAGVQALARIQEQRDRLGVLEELTSSEAES